MSKFNPVAKIIFVGLLANASLTSSSWAEMQRAPRYNSSVPTNPSASPAPAIVFHPLIIIKRKTAINSVRDNCSLPQCGDPPEVVGRMSDEEVADIRRQVSAEIPADIQKQTQGKITFAPYICTDDENPLKTVSLRGGEPNHWFIAKADVKDSIDTCLNKIKLMKDPRADLPDGSGFDGIFVIPQGTSGSVATKDYKQLIDVCGDTAGDFSEVIGPRQFVKIGNTPIQGGCNSFGFTFKDAMIHEWFHQLEYFYGDTHTAWNVPIPNDSGLKFGNKSGDKGVHDTAAFHLDNPPRATQINDAQYAEMSHQYWLDHWFGPYLNGDLHKSNNPNQSLGFGDAAWSHGTPSKMALELAAYPRNKTDFPGNGDVIAALGNQGFLKSARLSGGGSSSTQAASLAKIPDGNGSFPVCDVRKSATFFDNTSAASLDNILDRSQVSLDAGRDPNSIYADLKKVETHLRYWQSHFPADCWLPRRLFLLGHLYAQIPTAESQAKKKDLYGILTSQYAPSEFAQAALLEMNSSLDPNLVSATRLNQTLAETLRAASSNCPN